MGEDGAAAAAAENGEAKGGGARIVERAGQLLVLSGRSQATSEALSALVARAAGFCQMDVRTACGRTFNAGAVDNQRCIPPEMRLASVFLTLLGRDLTPQATEDIVEGVPKVVMAQPLEKLPPDHSITLSARVVSEVAEQRRSCTSPLSSVSNTSRTTASTAHDGRPHRSPLTGYCSEASASNSPLPARVCSPISPGASSLLSPPFPAAPKPAGKKQAPAPLLPPPLLSANGVGSGFPAPHSPSLAKLIASTAPPLHLHVDCYQMSDFGESFPDPPALYGTKSFSITAARIAELEKTTRVALGAGLPVLFYAALCRLTTHEHHISFFSYLRSVPLEQMAVPKDWDLLAAFEQEKNEEHRKKLAQLTGDLEKLAAEEEEQSGGSGDRDVSATVRRMLWDRSLSEIAVKNSAAHVQYLTNRGAGAPITRSARVWDEFLRAVRANPAEYGYTSKEALDETLRQALTELCTSVCVSQHGYYFVDGAASSGTMNMIHPPTRDTVVFLSAPGLDFCTNSATRREMPKYFKRNPESAGDAPLRELWKGFTATGEADLRKRVKNLYKVIFASARLQGARNLSMLPMGLGVFLTHVNGADQDCVKKAYFCAQYELLSEEGWGFDTYWLNPAQHRTLAEQLLREGVATGEYDFKCNVVLHNRDAKFLAVELAKEGLKPAVLNPSDCIAVMQGLIGYYWELGRGNRYVGEEDFAATSTGILARHGLTAVYTDASRMLQVDATEARAPCGGGTAGKRFPIE
ncbi:hypothetical protein DIPPA_05499 [Diplonema papillatum]|nr:hypothetical protein DIPPA_05499 [Diplonema papillatum]